MLSLSSLPHNLRRLLLFGVPSVALFGVVGVAACWWLRKRDSRVPTHGRVNCTDVHANTGQFLNAGQISPGSEDSGVVTNSQGAVHEKTSTESLPDSAHHHGLPFDSETPLMVIEKGWTYPTASSDLQSETLSELASISSSDGIASMPATSIHPSPVLDEFTKACKRQGITTSSSLSKLESPQVTDSPNIQSSRSTPSLMKPDRIRVMVQLPRDLVGRFIGKQGRNIKALMADSNGAHIYVNQKNLPNDTLFVPCTVQGTAEQVETALNIMASRYPEVDVPTKVDRDAGNSHTPLPSPLFGTPRLNGESWELVLNPPTIPASPFNAMVSFIESLNHIWLVTSDTSQELDEQHHSMSYTYCYASATLSNSVTAKEGDHDLLGKFCAVKVSDIHWLRGQVIKFTDDNASYEVQLMDYGSIVIVPPNSIRPLRREHAQLNIQAFRCQMANIVPLQDGTLLDEGLVALQSLVEGMVLEVHISGHDVSSDKVADDPAATCCQLQIPLVELYSQFGSQTPVFVNRELVERGFATWVEGEDLSSPPSSSASPQQLT